VIPDELYAELDPLPESEIERRLAQGIYGTEKKRQLVRLYLEQKATARAKNAQAEQTEIARSAKDAAWASAEAAKGANTRSTVAIIISIVALVLAAATFIKTFLIALGPWWP
jgi:hypothetical protein